MTPRTLVSRLPHALVTLTALAFGSAVLLAGALPAEAAPLPDVARGAARQGFAVDRGAVRVVMSVPAASRSRTARPVPATATRTARNVPALPPAGSGTGRRIVYSKALMTVWVVDAKGLVVRRFPVSGRFDRPNPVSYRIFSKSPSSSSSVSQVTFHQMIRFAYGPRTGAAIGFHTIPVYYANHDGHRAGSRMQRVDQLGMAVGVGGCPHLGDADADFLYRWSRLGDRVVVLRSP